MRGETSTFVNTVPDYEIRDGVMHVTSGDGWSCCFSLRTFKQGMARAQRAIDEYEARTFSRDEIPTVEGSAAKH
jgi:hypothetical protein